MILLYLLFILKLTFNLYDELEENRSFKEDPVDDTEYN